jgi:UDP-GlcNAc:undecaprenyl-phosphate GlcNAc-1-phosphate transferase
VSPLLHAAVVAGLALILTAGLTSVVRRAALRAGLVASVRSDRWHGRAVPALGGVAIFAGFALALGAGWLLDSTPVRAMAGPSPQALLPWSPWEGLLLGSSLAFLVGLADDLVDLRPLPKLFGQGVAASALVASGTGLWLTGWWPLDAAVSLLWFVGLTNALNLLDNMDGLAGGVAAIAGLYLAVLFLLEGQAGPAVAALAFTGALAGFLAHNYPPARIFMGDSGSLFLGLFLAGLALAPAPGLSRSLAGVLAAPVLILGVPILDTTLVTVGRILEGRPVSQGGRDHTSHRFVTLGMSEKGTVWLLWGLAAVGGAVGLLLRSAERGVALLLGGVLVGMLAILGGYLLSTRLKELEAAGAAERLSLYRFLVRSQEQYPVAALFLDGVWVTLAYYAAYLVRWEPAELAVEMVYFERTVLVWVGVKMLALIVTGTYASRWHTFGLYDAGLILRNNVLATVLAAGLLLMLDRVGLSRGVVAIDLLVCIVLTLGARFSFRIIEGTARHLSEEGTPVVLIAPHEDAEMAARYLHRLSTVGLRPVAAADPVLAASRARLGALPLFGGVDCLTEALAATGASAVVVVGDRERNGDGERLLRSHLERNGALDVYRMDVRVHRDGSS